MITWLIDTGPLVAYLDASEPGHTEIAAAAEPFRGLLVTTSAVVTEAMHFVSVAPDGPRLLSDLLLSWDVRVFDYSATQTLPHVVRLMERYASVPMDFADATLVLLADELDAHDVLTLDRRGFATYRTPSGNALRNVLDG